MSQQRHTSRPSIAKFEAFPGQLVSEAKLEAFAGRLSGEERKLVNGVVNNGRSVRAMLQLSDIFKSGKTVSTQKLLKISRTAHADGAIAEMDSDSFKRHKDMLLAAVEISSPTPDRTSRRFSGVLDRYRQECVSGVKTSTVRRDPNQTVQ